MMFVNDFIVVSFCVHLTLANKRAKAEN